MSKHLSGVLKIKRRVQIQTTILLGSAIILLISQGQIFMHVLYPRQAVIVHVLKKKLFKMNEHIK